MAPLRTSELPANGAVRSDAFHNRQALRRPTSTQNVRGESDRVGGGFRVLRVLVVAAEQHAANSLLRQVRYAGHAADAALNGLAACRTALAWQPDVVLLELEAPLMDGCQVAKQLRSVYLSEECLMIAFAVWVDDARRKPCFEAGIDLLLGKPIAQDVLETLLTLECVRVNHRWGGGGLPRNDLDGTSTTLHRE